MERWNLDFQPLVLNQELHNVGKLMEHPDFCMKPSDSSEVCSISSDNLVVCEGGCEEVGPNRDIKCESNGCADNDDTLSDASKLHDLRSDMPEFCNKSTLTAFHSKSSDSTDIVSKSSKMSEARGNVSDEARRTKKFSVAKVSKTKSISVDFRLSRGIAEVSTLYF